MADGERRLAPTYDVRLAHAFDGLDLERPLPTLWKEFDLLADVPMLVVHGANSDILSAATVKGMRERRAKMEIIEIADQGHVPLLEGEDLLRQIACFLTTCKSRAAQRRG